MIIFKNEEEIKKCTAQLKFIIIFEIKRKIQKKRNCLEIDDCINNIIIAN